MKITAFPAGRGDCLLVTSDGRHMLVDGGDGMPYEEHVRPVLHKLAATLDLVCVSHIDNDHISGVLKLMDDLVKWAVHDFQTAGGNDRHKPPRFPAPEVKAVWHNGFADQLRGDSADVQRMLSQAAAVMSGTTEPRLSEQAKRNAAIAQGVKEALTLSRRLGGDQLGIPLNPEFGGKMVLAGKGNGKLKLGKARISVLGPTPADLLRLRADWKKWLDDNKAAVEEARARAHEDERRLGNSEVARLVRPLELQAEVFGNRSKVTAPNLASILLLLEEGKTTALLTGDGHGRDVIAGLERLGRLDAGATFHVDLLKLPHHAAKDNFDADFFDRVTADHYLVCADGSHKNPDLDVLRLLLRARLKPSDNRRFTLWFTNSSTVLEAERTKRGEDKVPGREKHMAEVEGLVAEWKDRHPGRFRARFRGTPGTPRKPLEIKL